MAYLPALNSPGSLSPRAIQRQTSREIALAQAHGAMASAYDGARVQALAQVAEAALLATSHVSALEGLLVSRTPHAEARLRHIADAGCAGMASIVLGMGGRL